jgi:hypothetical protein
MCARLEDQVTQRLAARFQRFAEVEAHGSSPLYEALALGVAGDAFALEFLKGLPEAKRQPLAIWRSSPSLRYAGRLADISRHAACEGGRRSNRHAGAPHANQ